MNDYMHKSRAASPVQIFRPDENGTLKPVEVVPAGSLETVRIKVGNKRGRKKPDPNRFAESENECHIDYLAPGKRY